MYHSNRLLSAMCFSFYCFRFVQLFEINDQIGPKVFMLKKMAIDLFFFLFLLLVNLKRRREIEIESKREKEGEKERERERRRER